MKFIHLSDLHLGKRVNEFSMYEDQKYILNEILGIIDVEKPDGVIIAGDVYDKSGPSAESVALFDDFLVGLVERKLQVFVISGNHDSPERIAYGGRIMQLGGVHLSRVYDGKVTPLVMRDGYGEAAIYLLPFVKPANVRAVFPEENITSYTDALSVAISRMDVDKTRRNILVTHQFVTGASRSDSEDISVGGSDNVDASVFDDFDYVALGHIHGPQHVGRETVRYSGTPLKYSFSEAKHKKSVTVVELKEKGSVTVRTVPLKPLRDMVKLRGKYDELTSRAFYENTTYRSDYVQITLTDEDDRPDALGNLRIIYRNIMRLDYDNKRTRKSEAVTESDVQKSPLELLGDLYELQNNRKMTDEQTEFAKKLIEEIWEEK